MKKTADIVIVGAGSAGCTLANRLSANPNLKVTLIEAGPPDSSKFVQFPIGVAAMLPQFPIAKKYTWLNYNSQNEKYIGRQSIFQPRGKTLGGSSSLNAMIYMRGHKNDYNNWVAKGCAGWEYEKCLKYFKKSEGNDLFNNEYHNSTGELSVTGKHFYHQISDDFIEAGKELGYKEQQDFNDNDMYGVGRYQRTQRGGERCSTAKAFLSDEVKSRKNLKIETDLHVAKVLMEGNRAIGVVLIDKNGNEQIIKADQEVILSAGAMGSAQILQLSGIGNASELKQLGIESVVNLKGVGENFHDHPDVVIQACTKKGTPFNVHPKYLVQQIQDFSEYQKHRTGRFTSNIAEVGGFLKSNENLEVPDIQLHFVPCLITDHGRNLNIGKQGASLHVCHLRPKSKGVIKLQSKNPRDIPYMCLNYLKEKSDFDELVIGVQQSLRILKDTQFNKEYLTHFPQFSKTSDLDDIQKIKDFVFQNTDTIYHPVGSCKMGNDDMSVVDPEDLKVYNTQNLRVIDASIMPEVVSGNTNAPTIMIAEKTADKILSYY